MNSNNSLLATISKIKKEVYVLPIILNLFLIAVFWRPGFIYAFTQGKEILFKFIILTTWLIWILNFLHKKQYSFKIFFDSILFLLLLAQISWYGLSNVLSQTPIVTMYGTYSRGFGFIIELCLFAFTIYCSIYSSTRNVSKFIKVLFASSVIVSIYGILQKLGFNPFFRNYDTNIFVGRVFSFLGNPSYLGQFVSLNIIIASYLILTERNKFYRNLYIVGLMLLLVVLFFSGTRTALVALFAASLLVLGKYYRVVITIIKKHFITTLIIFLVIASLIPFLPHNRYSFSNLALRSINSRLEIWKGAIHLIKEKPLFGYGEETFYIYSPEIINKTFLTLEEDVNVSIDKVHNETLEIFFSHGLIGVLIYLAILVFMLRKFFYSQNPNIILLALMIIANAVQNQFAFPDITISIIIAFCFGALIALERPARLCTIKIKTIPGYLLSISFLFLIAYSMIAIVYRPYMSQIAYAESKNNYSNYTVAVNKHKEALNYTPYFSELWYKLMFIDKSSMQRALFYLQKIDGESGNVLAWQGNFYSDKDLEKASEFYTKALQKNPHYPNWIRAFADMLYANNDYQDALYLYNKYLEAVPDFWKWRDDLDKHSPTEQKSYEIFFKNVPYFWGTLEKINQIFINLSK